MDLKSSFVGSTTEHAEPLKLRPASEFYLVTPYPPSANHYKNYRVIPANRQTGKKAMVITYVDDVAKAFKHDVGVLARQAGVKLITGRVALHIQLFPNRPQDWKTRVRKSPDFWDDTVLCIDVGNAEKCISDALNGIAWRDDKQIRLLTVERMTPDEHGARCIVTIRPYGEVTLQASLL